MSKSDKIYARVNRELKENKIQMDSWNHNAIMSELRIKQQQKLIDNLERLHRDKINKLKLQIERAVKNAKVSRKKLDELIVEKEALHKEFKVAANIGRVQCKYCKKYFTSNGLLRHQPVCGAKPINKVVITMNKEIKKDKKEAEAHKLALLKELAELNEKMK